MRYLQVTLAGEAATLHPLVPTLTDPELFRDATMVDWAPSREPPRVTVLLYLDGDLAAFERVLAATDLVREFDVTSFGDGRGYAYVSADPHPTEWELFRIAASPGLVTASPIRYRRDGSISARIVGPTARLRAAVAATPDGVEATVERVGEYDIGRPPIPPSLPPRQREALATAFDAGYYEVPREAPRDEVAELLGCAPSTASEHLRKAERRLVATFLDRGE
jgi:predicted DNA binding protein